jgi:hypothetical protein
MIVLLAVVLIAALGLAYLIRTGDFSITFGSEPSHKVGRSESGSEGVVPPGPTDARD